MSLIKKITASVALVALMSGVFTTGAFAADSAAIEAANKLAEKGIVVDHSDNTSAYELSRNVLRQEIAAVARGLANVDKTTTCEGLFDDVSATKPNTWACYTVEALRKADLIAANKMFRPEDNITKSEAVGMVVKAAYGKEYMYDSSKAASWQEQVVAFANKKGIVDTFTDYNSLATRGFVFKAGANALKADSADEDVDNMLCETLGICTDDKDKTDDKDTTNTGSENNVDKDKENNVTLNKDVLVAELSPETPKDGNVAADTARVKLLGFDVTAGNTDVTLEAADLKFTGLGSSTGVTNLAIYDGVEKITKGEKRFYSDDTSSLNFEKNIVVKAGETKTLFVTATIKKETSNWNQTLQIALTNLEASSTVEMEKISGAVLTPILVRNVAKLELNSRKIGSNNSEKVVNVGELVTLADFSLSEENDKESANVKSITFDIGGSVDSDDISDLELHADGKEVKASFKVTSSQIVAELDTVIPQDKKINFLLKGTFIGSVNDTLKVTFEEDPVYAIGETSKISVGVSLAQENDKEVAYLKVEGSEINIAFNRSDIDEARPDSREVLIGNIDVSSVSDYTVKQLQVEVEARNLPKGKTIKDVLKTVELDGVSYDEPKEIKDLEKDTVKFIFEDIDLRAGKSKKLPLTIDVEDENNNNKIQGTELTFDVKVLEIKDEDNNKTYEWDSSNSEEKTSKILSATTFTEKTIDIKMASVTIASVEVNDTNVVLGNGVKTVLYKGKISVGDAGKVNVVSLDFIPSSDNNLKGLSVEDVVSEATLNIGGKVFKGDVSGNKIELNSINATILEGADNVEMLLVGVLKDNGNVEGNGEYKLSMKLDTDLENLMVEDQDGYELTKDNVTVDSANTNTTVTNLDEKGDFYVATVKNSVNKDDIKDVILAGTKNVNIGEVKIQADKEDAKVKKLSFVVTGTEKLVGNSTSNALSVEVKNTQEGKEPELSAEKSRLDVKDLPTSNGNVKVTVNEVEYSVAVMTSDTRGGIAEKIKDKINEGTGSVAEVKEDDTRTVWITAKDKTKNYTDISFDAGTTGMVANVLKIKNGNTATDYPQKTTVKLSRALETGDKLTYGSTGSLDTLAKLETEIKNDNSDLTTNISGNTIEVTGKTDGTAFTLKNITAQPKTTSGTETTNSDLDYSSTFENVRLMDGSKVLADGATLTYVKGGKTYITFKDFVLKASDSKIDAMLVADVVKYTTSGSETSAQLGSFTITPVVPTISDGGIQKSEYTDIQGANSQEDLDKSSDSGNFGGISESVSIVPVTVTVSVTNKLGNDDQYAGIRYTVDQGNNVLENTDINIKEVYVENAFTTGLTIRNDDNTSVVQSGGNTTTISINGGDSSVINNNDEWEFYSQDTGVELRLGKSTSPVNGIKYSVQLEDGVHEYLITNDKIINLGSYTN